MFYRYGYGYGGGGLLWDNTFILVIIGIALCAVASMTVRATFSKYSTMRVRSGLTGSDIAKKILNANNMGGVMVNRVGGNLSDHFDPRNMTVSLSESVFDSSSISAVAVAAHECGHVLQHRDGYGPYNLRHAMVPVVNISSTFSWILIVLGLMMSRGAQYAEGNPAQLLLRIGIICFSFAVAFQIVTLPVEFNASRRAIGILRSSNQFSEEELTAAKKVLTAAALTYVAGALSSILQLIRILLIANNRRR